MTEPENNQTDEEIKQLRAVVERQTRALNVAKTILDSQNMHLAVEEIEAIERGEK